MGNRFIKLTFTDAVKKMQEKYNSRRSYSRMEEGEDYNHLVSEYEAAFITERDSFYMATVGETGWPYVQHRGGPKGFVKILDESTIGFADYSGNKQYISTGNLLTDDRVSLFFMDYKNQRRLKMLGRVSIVDPTDTETLAKLELADFRAPVERGYMIKVEGFDWNCPKYITPRYTETEVKELAAPLINENKKLKELVTKNIDNKVNKLATYIGDGPLALVISGIRQITPNIRSYELRPACGDPLPEIQAGAHLSVPFNKEDGTIDHRIYSIHSDPHHKDSYEISVLRQDEGDGGSKSIHEQYHLGMTIHCQSPDNNFTIEPREHIEGNPAIMIAGGIGITPIMPIAKSFTRAGVKLELHYAGKSLEQMAYIRDLHDIVGDDLQLYIGDKKERLDISSLISSAPKGAIFYLCGPDRLLNAFLDEAKTQGILDEKIRFERFSHEIGSDARPVTLRLAKSNLTIEVGKNETLLDAILNAGIDAPYSCKVGDCRTCAVKVIEGEPDHKDSALSPDERETKQQFCPCVSRAKSETLVLDL